MLPLKCAVHKFLPTLLLFLSLSAVAEEIAVLKVIVNTEDLGEAFLLLDDKGDIWMNREDFARTRLKPGLALMRDIDGDSYR